MTPFCSCLLRSTLLSVFGHRIGQRRSLLRNAIVLPVLSAGWDHETGDSSVPTHTSSTPLLSGDEGPRESECGRFGLGRAGELVVLGSTWLRWHRGLGRCGMRWRCTSRVGVHVGMTSTVKREGCRDWDVIGRSERGG